MSTEVCQPNGFMETLEEVRNIIQNLGGYAPKSELDATNSSLTALIEKVNTLEQTFNTHTVDYNDLQNLPVIPSRLSELQNDENFLKTLYRSVAFSPATIRQAFRLCTITANAHALYILSNIGIIDDSNTGEQSRGSRTLSITADISQNDPRFSIVIDSKRITAGSDDIEVYTKQIGNTTGEFEVWITVPVRQGTLGISALYEPANLTYRADQIQSAANITGGLYVKHDLKGEIIATETIIDGGEI